MRIWPAPSLGTDEPDVADEHPQDISSVVAGGSLGREMGEKEALSAQRAREVTGTGGAVGVVQSVPGA